MQCVMRLERRPRLVSFTCARALGFAPGAASLAAAPEQLLLDVPLTRTVRLRRHAVIHYHGCAGCQLNGHI
jgi:hypothetical protein